MSIFFDNFKYGADNFNVSSNLSDIFFFKLFTKQTNYGKINLS